MAISLEVAEHLPESSAKTFVQTLTNASDVVLFSAAIPFQGGTNHVNEQWQSYWYKLFNEYGYVGTDYLRKKIFNNPNVDVFYKQNILLYVKKERIETIPKEYFDNIGEIDFVHPDRYWSRQSKFNVNYAPLSNLYKILLRRTIKWIIKKK